MDPEERRDVITHPVRTTADFPEVIPLAVRIETKRELFPVQINLSARRSVQAELIRIALEYRG